MKISIIIASYNEIQYLKASIDSCFMQKKGTDFEIIVGDDGSNDGTIDVLSEYKDKYGQQFNYFVMKRPSNTKDIIPSIRVSNLLKRAFDMAHGEYIVVLSGDDLFIDTEKLYMQSKFLDSNFNYISCYTDYCKFWDDGKQINYLLGVNYPNSVLWALEYIHISCFLFRKQVLDNILERFCDDTGLVYSIIKTGKCKYIPVLTFGYRQRNNSIMHEADALELAILEISLFQDVVNKGGYTASTLSRFAKSLHYVFVNRKCISNNKYNKYINDSKKYKNNILGNIEQYDNLKTTEKIKCQTLLILTSVSYLIYKLVRKINRVLQKS